jgi:alpha-1,3-glucan synthase
MIDGFRPECKLDSFSQNPKKVDKPNKVPSRDSYSAPYSMSGHDHEMTMANDGYGGEMYEEGPNDARMTKLQIFVGRTIGGWPLYAIIISFGQLVSAVRTDLISFQMHSTDVQTSFQLSLLGGSNTQTEIDLYIICSIFVVATIAWYTLFRMKPSVYVLSLPWLWCVHLLLILRNAILNPRFAVAFILIGFPSLRGVFTPPRKTITRVATYCYAIASAAGFLFFGLNFGEEAGAATEVWITRACIVQGLQQIWVSALWYWGYTLNGTDPKTYVTPRAIMYVTWPLSVMSIAFAYLLFFGLPDYYRQVSHALG